MLRHYKLSIKVLFCVFLLYSVCFTVQAEVKNEEESVSVYSTELEQFPNFSIYRKGSDSGPTLLVVGGIQGDEPGGFSAASLLATRYEIKSGNVWVVPNLNFPSIVRNSRGLHGDMNRKFAQLSANDPELTVVRRIQQLIVLPEVDLVLNLHDGSGFYRPQYESALKNPKRWGQCIVIDQEKIDDELVQNKNFQNLNGLASSVAQRVNGRLLSPLHAYHIKDTKTRQIDLEMQKTLSYFAVCQGKAAFGLEASKELDAASRIFYHMQLLEAFMDEMGIVYEREFELSPAGIQAALNHDIHLALYDNRTVLALDNARPSTAGYIPVTKDANFSAKVSNPLLAVLPGKNEWKVYYGNRALTSFRPEYREFDDSISFVNLEIDGEDLQLPIGGMVNVNNVFMVRGIDGYRVNAIGATQDVNGTESDVPLKRAHFQDRYSLDKGASIYRVEFYKGNAYCGMILVNFGSQGALDSGKMPLTAQTGNNNENTGR